MSPIRNRPLSKLAWATWWKLAKYAGRSYVAGPELTDALRVCRRLEQNGYICTIGFWNSDDESAVRTAASHRAALAAIAEEKLNAYPSLKLRLLEFDQDRLRSIVGEAGGHGWLPYSLTQARRNPQMIGWGLRDLFSLG